MRGLTPGILITLLIVGVCAEPARAQGTETDARIVAMGGRAGASRNIASGLVSSAMPDIVIPVPLGLIDVFRGGLDKFIPGRDTFDPVQSIEVSSTPLHYTFGRQENTARQAFINDLVGGQLNPDLTTYSGFVIPETLQVEGLIDRRFGGIVKFAKGADRFHGVFLGVGPYLSFDTQLDVDPRLVDMLGNGTPYTNAQLALLNHSQVQLAMAITVGYRGRVSMGPSSSGERDGLYLAVNYNVLRGFRYFEPDSAMRFDTDAAGRLTAAPEATPVSIAAIQGRSGQGRSIDLGVQIVRGAVEAGFGVNGVGNRIDWTDFTLTTYSLPSLVSAFDYTATEGVAPFTDLRVTLPVVKTANVAVSHAGWSAMASAADGFNGRSVHGGVERQLGRLWVRGGARYTRGAWDPTWGVGIGGRITLDVGFYGNRNNLEGRRATTMAVSLRIGQGPMP